MKLQLSTSPIDALMPGTRLVTGCMRETEGVRLWIGPRYNDESVLIPAGPDADHAEGQWRATNHTGRFFARLVDPNGGTDE